MPDMKNRNGQDTKGKLPNRKVTPRQKPNNDWKAGGSKTSSRNWKSGGNTITTMGGTRPEAKNSWISASMAEKKKESSSSLTAGVSKALGDMLAKAKEDAGKAKEETLKNKEESGKWREVAFPDSVIGTVNGMEKKLNPREDWGLTGNGEYKEGVQKDADGRYLIAVGPKLIDPNYPDDGRIWNDDFKEFNNRVNIHLQNRTDEEDTRVIECVVNDYKAHTYNTYPDGHKNDTGDKVSFDVENGLIQTGISYPNSENNWTFAPDNVDGSLIEFCGTEVDFPIGDYDLLKIMVLKEAMETE